MLTRMPEDSSPRPYDMLAALKNLPDDAELLAFEAG
jgi:hypothetical protein